MNINSDFDLKKAKNFLLTENFDASYLQEDDLEENEMLDEMASFYSIKPDVDEDEAKAAIADYKAKLKPGSAFYKTLDSLEKTGEADYKEFKKATISPEKPEGKDIATWNNPDSRSVLEKDGPLAAFLNASSSPSAKRTGRPVDPNKPAKPEAKPKAAKTPGEQKIKITPSKSKPSDDDKVDTKVEKDSRSKDEMIKAKRNLEAQRMEVNKAFKAGDKSAISKLKDLTNQINVLSKKLGV